MKPGIGILLDSETGCYSVRLSNIAGLEVTLQQQWLEYKDCEEDLETLEAFFNHWFTEKESFDISRDKMVGE
jgi:hypothetical protein